MPEPDRRIFPWPSVQNLKLQFCITKEESKSVECGNLPWKEKKKTKTPKFRNDITAENLYHLRFH